MIIGFRAISQENQAVYDGWNINSAFKAIQAVLADFKKQESTLEGVELLAELTTFCEARGWGIGIKGDSLHVSTDILCDQTLCCADTFNDAVVVLSDLLRKLGTVVELDPRLDAQAQMDELEEVFRTEHCEAGEVFLESDFCPGEYGFWTEEYECKMQSRQLKI